MPSWTEWFPIQLSILGGRRAKIKYDVDQLGPSQGSGESLIHQATVALTDAQIKLLPTVPVEIVAAPGVDRVIIPTLVALRLDNSAGGYTGVGVDGFIDLDYGGFTSDASSTIRTDAFLTNPGVKVGLTGGPTMFFDVLPSYLNGISQQLSDVGNAPLKVQAVDGGDYGGGNAANTLTVSVVFHVYDVATGRYLTTVESGWNDTTGAFD